MTLLLTLMKPPWPIEDDEGNMFSVDEEGRLHSFFDRPSVVKTNGQMFWHKHGVLSRNNGPSIIYADGTEVWFKNGVLSREGNLPCVIYPSGTNKYFLNGLMHRTNGPAEERPNGPNFWYWMGCKVEELKEHFSFIAGELKKNGDKEKKE